MGWPCGGGAPRESNKCRLPSEADDEIMQTQPMSGARFVDPKILARIGSLDLLARTVVDGFINGLHRAPYFGASIDFAEHRGYVPGDDIRRVDWRADAGAESDTGQQKSVEPNNELCPLHDT